MRVEAMTKLSSSTAWLTCTRSAYALFLRACCSRSLEESSADVANYKSELTINLSQ